MSLSIITHFSGRALRVAGIHTEADFTNGGVFSFQLLTIDPMAFVTAFNQIADICEDEEYFETYHEIVIESSKYRRYVVSKTVGGLVNMTLNNWTQVFSSLNAYQLRQIASAIKKEVEQFNARLGCDETA